MDKKKLIPSAAVLFVMASIIINPAVYIQSAQKGMILFVMTVLPALFPFFFFSKLLCLFEADIAMGNLLGRPLRRLYNSPPSGGYILLMSLMCGYPIGAKLISDYYNDNIINRDDANSLAALASTGGPLFILGTIGTIILNNRIAAVIILISHYLSALLNGLIFRRRDKSKSNFMPKVLPTTLKDSIYSAVISILMVGGYIIVFNIICDMLLNYRMIDILSAAVDPLMGKVTNGFLLSIVEVTRGAVIMGGSGATISELTPAIAAAVTFGGMSVILQSVTFLESAGVKTGKFIIMKLCQCVIAYIIAFLLAKMIF